MTFIVDMNEIYFVGSLKIAGAQNVWFSKRLVCQTFGLLEAEGLTFIPINVRLLLFGKYRKKHIWFFFPFVSLLCDTIQECCWVIASITISVRRSSIKVLRCCSYVILSWEIDTDVFSLSIEGDNEYVLRRL